jgi:arginine decarboxylase
MIDLQELGRSGYDVNEWLRANHRVTWPVRPRHVVAQITVADDEETVDGLVAALRDLVGHVEEVPPARPVEIPPPGELELEQALLPRDAFFGEVEKVPVQRAPGRIAAETISPYPPGAPAILPGEVITQTAIDYLRSGVGAGMHLPDATSPSLDVVRVVPQH